MHTGTRTGPSENITPILQSAAGKRSSARPRIPPQSGGKRVSAFASGCVVYVLSGAKLKFSYPDGRTEERTAATGETIWRDPTTHAVENVGDTEAHAITIDLKLLASINATPAAYQAIQLRSVKPNHGAGRWPDIE